MDASKIMPISLKMIGEAALAKMGFLVVDTLLWININVVQKLNPKLCFWGLFFGSCALGYVLAAVVGLVMGIFATAASYTRPVHPEEIPLSPYEGTEVLLGRPIQVSEDVAGLHANNNVTITTFKNQYIVAYRQSDSHFASTSARIVVAASDDLCSWQTTWMFNNGCDLRETLLFEMHTQLILYFFSLEPKAGKFTPIDMFYTTSTDAVVWSKPAQVCRAAEVPWDIKVTGVGEEAVAYKASYLGDHYGEGDLSVLFERSLDGITWSPAGKSSSSIVYHGGVSEVSFEFTAARDLVAIGRNEDGDKTGFGSQLFYASKDDLGSWTPLQISIPWRFDSPRLTCTASDEILLFARYAPDRFQFMPSWLPFAVQKAVNLISHSFLSKSAAVYRIVPHKKWGAEGKGAVQLIRHFEHTVSDTGFFSVTRELTPQGCQADATKECFVVANYSSTTVHSHTPWFFGQMTPSQTYVCRCHVISPSNVMKA